MKSKTNKACDCVATKREAQERINQRTRGKSLRERGEYLEKQASAGPMGAWWKEAKAAGRTGAKRGRSRPSRAA